MTETAFTPASPLANLPEGSAAEFRLGGVAVLLCHTGGEVFAVAPTCSHAHESLACGVLRGGWIACPAHGARFDLATGEPLGPPATTAIATYAVRVVDGMIEVAV